MKTLTQILTAGGTDSYRNFAGDLTYHDWLLLVTVNRDSDALARSNFRQALAAVGGEGGDVRVERHGHWACGWVDLILVRPGSGAARLAESVEAALEDYPVLDDEDYAKEEREEAEQVWRTCYTDRDRLRYIRGHEDSFALDGVADALANVRGRRFGGDAAGLLS